MKILETSKFERLRKKIREAAERDSLKEAIREVEKNPDAGKKLKGEFALLRSYQYTASGQARRLVYRWEKDLIILFSFGPREGIYK
jgi:mRNA-degrading endonuclease RelE of RelBE toxin-antitoxin system